MTLAAIGIEAAIIVVLLLVIGVGQPAAVAAEHAQNVSYKATFEAVPRPTVRPCRTAPTYIPGC